MKQDCFILITPGFPKDEEDSACLPFIQKWCKAYLSLNPSFKLLIISFQYPFQDESYQWHDIEVYPMGGKNSKNPLKRLKVWRNTWQLLKQIQIQYQIKGILNLWLTECSLIGLKFGRKYGITAKSWLIGQDSELRNKYIRLIKPKEEEIMSMSENLSERLQKHHGIQAKYLVYNGIDESDFSALKPETRSIDILGVASLIPLKQIDQFIDVIKALHALKPNLHCVLIGDGVLRNKIQMQIQEAGLQNTIQLMGTLAHSITLNYMNQSKILLHCSRSEGNSTVFSEAIRAGCYVISYAVGYVHSNNKHLIGADTLALQDLCKSILSNSNSTFEYQKVHTMQQSFYEILSLYNI